jgi:hypothetical protein
MQGSMSSGRKHRRSDDHLTYARITHKTTPHRLLLDRARDTDPAPGSVEPLRLPVPHNQDRRAPGAGRRGHACRLGALAASILGVVVLAAAACGSGQAAVPPAVTPRPPACHPASPPPGLSHPAHVLICNNGTVIVGSGWRVTPQTRSLQAVAIAGRVPVPGFAQCLARHGVTATIPGGPGRHKLPPAQAAAFTACSTPVRSPAASPPRAR